MDLQAWARQVEAARSKKGELVKKLRDHYGAVEATPLQTNNVCSLPYHLQWYFDSGVVVTIYILLLDWQAPDIQQAPDSHLTITNMTVWPESRRREGYGSKALQQLFAWASNHGLRFIRAVQIRRGNEGFWQKHGFIRASEPNPSNDHVLVLG